MPAPLLIAKNRSTDLLLLPALANRHGCITGATGTGKTVTLQTMAQALSDIGVPVFMADVKGDLSGMAKAGVMSPRIQTRLDALGLPEPAWHASPVTFWDVFGEKGHPVRATISDMGPLLVARMLNLNDTQQGVLQLVFKIADDHGLLLLDSKDLRAMLRQVGDNAAQFQTEYGNISAASIGAIQRGLVGIEEQGGDRFFGEPMLNIDDLLQTDANGRGLVNILAADKLLNAPRLYSTFLLWLLSELFEHLPEVGDLEKPKLAFFFDEAHLLFDEAPKPLLQKIEQVVRLIRSKGVGIYFVTQNPLDIPDTVLGQLGNRVQHALRAYTPRDQKAVQAAAETFRPNPLLDTARAITELEVGEALVSFLDEKGRPGIVERAFVLPPASQIGPISDAERAEVIAGSLVAGVYEQVVDRESAYEKIRGRVDERQPVRQSAAPAAASRPAPAPAAAQRAVPEAASAHENRADGSRAAGPDTAPDDGAGALPEQSEQSVQSGQSEQSERSRQSASPGMPTPISDGWGRGAGAAPSPVPAAQRRPSPAPSMPVPAEPAPQRAAPARPAPAGSAPPSRPAQPEAPPDDAGPGLGGRFKDAVGDAMGGLFGGTGIARRKDTVVEAMVKSAARSIGSTVGREIIRGVLGSILKK